MSSPGHVSLLGQGVGFDLSGSGLIGNLLNYDPEPTTLSAFYGACVSTFSFSPNSPLQACGKKFGRERGYNYVN